MGDEVKELVFSKKRQEIPVTLESEDGDVKMVLREFSGAIRSTFLDYLNSKTEIKNGKVSKMSNVGAIQSRLISLCLYHDNKAVPEKEILEMASTTIDGLFKAAQKLNGLDEGAEDEAKND